MEEIAPVEGKVVDPTMYNVFTSQVVQDFFWNQQEVFLELAQNVILYD